MPFPSPGHKPPALSPKHGRGILAPVGSINPVLPDWEEDLRRCLEARRMRVIRVHPNYHRYRLDDPRFARLLELAAARGLVLQIPLIMEDERTQDALVQVPPVDPTPLVGLLQPRPAARVMLLNCFRGLRSNRVLLARLAGEKQPDSRRRGFFNIAGRVSCR